MKIVRIIKNPEIIKLALSGKDKAAIKHHLYVKRQREIMAEICDFIDSRLDDDLHSLIEEASAKFNFIKYVITWYALARKYKPKIIVETGVSMGFSSLMLLNAIRRNGFGQLYSIDIGMNESVGYMVPEEMRQKWNLIIGDTNQKLEPLLKELGRIDMFIHDSEHSAEVMRFEFELARQHLKQGGLLCSDDINHNDAWEQFVKKYNYKPNLLQEIAREFDDKNLRPYFGYLLV